MPSWDRQDQAARPVRSYSELVARPNALGEYLRARRELMDPADAGLRAVGVRRTPGLRREEVATLAGISADYYLRLEQGRDRNPSPQVLQALARVFGLDATATEYLLSLPAARPGRPGRRRARVQEGIRQLLSSLNLPAFVEDRLFDVLAANELATALDPGIQPGQNRARRAAGTASRRDGEAHRSGPAKSPGTPDGRGHVMSPPVRCSQLAASSRSRRSCWPASSCSACSS